MRRALPTLASLAYLAPIALLAGAASGCSDLSRFSTGPDESYCGVVTGADFVRSDGLVASTPMRLALDVDALESRPGLLWTGSLAPGEAFQATPLRAIPQLSADELSNLAFGDGNLKTSIAVAELTHSDAAGVLQHTEVTVVLSLMRSGEVYVRLLRGDGSTTWSDGTPKPPQIFGVFRLTKTAGDCGLR